MSEPFRDNLKTLGEEISHHRELRRMTNNDIARLASEKTGLIIRGNEVSAYAKGRYRRVGPRTIAGIAEVLDPADKTLPYRWCALAGKIHSDIETALMAPDFAVSVGEHARKALG